MASTLNLAHVHRPSIVKFGSLPSAQFVGFGAVIGKLKLPTDSIGSHTLTLGNVVAGSRVHIETQDGATTIYDALAGGTGFVSVPVTLPVYPAGAAANSVRVRIRKASGAPYYTPYETLATVGLGASSIYVSQIADE